MQAGNTTLGQRIVGEENSKSCHWRAEFESSSVQGDTRHVGLPCASHPCSQSNKPRTTQDNRGETCTGQERPGERRGRRFSEPWRRVAAEGSQQEKVTRLLRLEWTHTKMDTYHVPPSSSHDDAPSRVGLLKSCAPSLPYTQRAQNLPSVATLS